MAEEFDGSRIEKTKKVEQFNPDENIFLKDDLTVDELEEYHMNFLDLLEESFQSYKEDEGLNNRKRIKDLVLKYADYNLSRDLSSVIQNFLVEIENKGVSQDKFNQIILLIKSKKEQLIKIKSIKDYNDIYIYASNDGMLLRHINTNLSKIGDEINSVGRIAERFFSDKNEISLYKIDSMKKNIWNMKNIADCFYNDVSILLYNRIMQSKIIFNKIVLQNDMSDDEKILKIAEIRTKEEGDWWKFIPSSVTPGAIIGVTWIKNAVNNAFDEYILDIFDLKPVGEGYDRFYLAEYNSMIQSNSIW